MTNKFFITLRSKLYFVPGAYAIVFTLLAIVFIYLDHVACDGLAGVLPDVLFTSRSAAGAIVSTAAGSLLTMLTITFSIMMVVLTIYGSQLSPRSLQDFLEKKETLRILGFFIGALMFSIISLFAIKPQESSQPMLAPLVCILLLIIAVFVFAYFIHYISKAVQISLYIQKLVKETAAKIEKKQKIIADDPSIRSANADEFAEILAGKDWTIKADRSGFIQHYDEKKLYACAKGYHAVIVCEKMVGNHVLEDEPLIRVFGMKVPEKSEEIAAQLRDMVIIGDETNLYEDIGAGTRKLSEIAIKALSPGINDPSTAEFCIEQIGFLLKKVARGLEAKVHMDEEKEVRLIVQNLKFDRLLYYHFYQIKHYGIKDLMILDAICGALITIAKESGYSVRKQVWDFAEYLISQVNYQDYPDIEQSYIRERFYQLAKATGSQGKLDTLTGGDR